MFFQMLSDDLDQEQEYDHEGTCMKDSHTKITLSTVLDNNFRLTCIYQIYISICIRDCLPILG
jgi:hypothetical protein